MKVDLLSQHQVIETIDANKIDCVFCGKRLYCDELSFDNFG